ncbi:hypothetical protein [Chenggangzhangella methanolivorans]|uniref:Cytochrome c domain-containing protein n=1 Tax=Chenggangzhangella methanolivorans TaxID=1437009 RepID=A0A9E6UJ07_9HYPH|nr:hypothetical protein [Chenggangzhangella methanolivorans]QZO01443.1 hypothetical protein K6K41_08360 [Chenggangzhangella methanolivorans]
MRPSAAAFGAEAASAPRRRFAVAALVVVALAAAAVLAWRSPIARGYMLFHGHAALEAKIFSGVALPVSASACVNCHEGAASGGPRAIARLDRTTFSAPRTPRGGAPVSYDEASFCRLMREGVDPASVMVSRLMPRFDVSDADCAALFAYVSRRP